MITREELYQLVWSVAGKVAAAKLDVSDSYLNRVCKALDVPRPPPGWWAKRQAGRAPAPPPLPAARPGRLAGWSRGDAGGAPIRPHYRRKDLIYGPVLADIHLLVAHAREVYSAAERSFDGALLLANPRYHTIDLTVSETSLECCLQFANALFVELEGRGHRITLAAGCGFIRPPISNWGRQPSHLRVLQPDRIPRSPTVVHIRGVPVGLAILEIVEEAEMRYVGGGAYVPASTPQPKLGIHWTEWRRTPTGRLRLAAYSPYHPLPWLRDWTEWRRNSFSRKAKAMATELEAAASELGKAREAHDRTSGAALVPAGARDSPR
ncbi:hypothetical protein [Rhizobium sp. BK060]|uniref:hypothetical protein n=1 Tax=Rhizobium sp. BK060 TaxID=2587096 RepID=UPI001607343C|nr:hypothetical protein [Rhizobium sp. BK060]MBB3398833.1 hypothetical protein [Rhizobium sp. BK060]